MKLTLTGRLKLMRLRERLSNGGYTRADLRELVDILLDERYEEEEEA